MSDYFSIQQAAKIVNMTSETLRHYDRIGLVKPCFTEAETQYRYYSEQELIRLQTVGLLKQMGMPLADIRDILSQDDLAKVVAFFKRAEKNADREIARLRNAKGRIQLARADYEKKLKGGSAPKGTEPFQVRHIRERAILISNHLEQASIKNLWNYHSHFYQQLGEAAGPQYSFEDMAGIVTRRGQSRLFAVCTKYPGLDRFTLLPEGRYLCSSCTEEMRADTIRAMTEVANAEYGISPVLLVQDIVIIGILQWSYQIQIFLGP